MSGNGTVHANAKTLKFIRMMLTIIVWKQFGLYISSQDQLDDEYENCWREKEGDRPKHPR